MFRRPTPEPAGPDQESVWDYPRPPRIEPAGRHIAIDFGGQRIVDSGRALRVLETSHPPTYYMPPDDIVEGVLRPVHGKSSHCEWKGRAVYYDVVVGEQVAPAAAWAYPDPTPGSGMKPGYVAFYAAPMQACWVDGERAEPQPGGFYGGWVTPFVAGPFKGGPGSWGW